MKKSELKQLIREVIFEVGYNNFRLADQDKPLATKFFLATYGYIKKHGTKKRHYNAVEPSKGWDGDSWTLGDATASDENKHYNKTVSGKDVSVEMAKENDLIFVRGDLNKLKELLVSIIK